MSSGSEEAINPQSACRARRFAAMRASSKGSRPRMLAAQGDGSSPPPRPQPPRCRSASAINRITDRVASLKLLRMAVEAVRGSVTARLTACIVSTNVAIGVGLDLHSRPKCKADKAERQEGQQYCQPFGDGHRRPAPAVLHRSGQGLTARPRACSTSRIPVRGPQSLHPLWASIERMVWSIRGDPAGIAVREIGPSIDTNFGSSEQISECFSRDERLSWA